MHVQNEICALCMQKTKLFSQWSIITWSVLGGKMYKLKRSIGSSLIHHHLPHIFFVQQANTVKAKEGLFKLKTMHNI